jgi:hypothetical protein
MLPGLITIKIGDAAGNAKAYYWLMLQIVFAIIGPFASIP